MTDIQPSCFFSPAKINLFLRILNKRPDGYHDLATLMQAISLGDFIYIRKATFQDSLTCTDLKLPLDGSNLVLRAAELFRIKSGIPLYVTIHLDKRIPIEAGLGGGSSNAATVLWAMNELAGLPFCSNTLLEWSAEIGSDIPFFFATGSAYCRGRGESVRSVEPINIPYIWIVKPPQGLSTRKVFSLLDINRLPQRDPDASLDAFKGQSGHLLYNDLEETALQIEPTLALLYKILKEQYAGHVLMSGSGSSFFCLGDHVPKLCQQPSLPPCFIQRVTCMQRDLDHWYTLEATTFLAC